MSNITDEEWRRLSREQFDTTMLLDAVDAVDELRGELNDGEQGSPPQLRHDLLKLHRLAMVVSNRGARGHVADLFELAGELEFQVSGIRAALEQLHEIPLQLTALSDRASTASGTSAETSATTIARRRMQGLLGGKNARLPRAAAAADQGQDAVQRVQVLARFGHRRVELKSK